MTDRSTELGALRAALDGQRQHVLDLVDRLDDGDQLLLQDSLV